MRLASSTFGSTCCCSAGRTNSSMQPRVGAVPTPPATANSHAAVQKHLPKVGEPRFLRYPQHPPALQQLREKRKIPMNPLAHVGNHMPQTACIQRAQRLEGAAGHRNGTATRPFRRVLSVMHVGTHESKRVSTVPYAGSRRHGNACLMLEPFLNSPCSLLRQPVKNRHSRPEARTEQGSTSSTKRKRYLGSCNSIASCCWYKSSSLSRFLFC